MSHCSPEPKRDATPAVGLQPALATTIHLYHCSSALAPDYSSCHQPLPDIQSLLHRLLCQPDVQRPVTISQRRKSGGWGPTLGQACLLVAAREGGINARQIGSQLVLSVMLLAAVGCRLFPLQHAACHGWLALRTEHRRARMLEVHGAAGMVCPDAGPSAMPSAIAMAEEQQLWCGCVSEQPGCMPVFGTRTFFWNLGAAARSSTR